MTGRRQLVVSEFVTLDGVMEAPGGEPSHPHTGWVADSMGPEQERYKFDEVLEASALLIGRVTYESFAGAWPTYQGEFADRMNSMPKHIVSTTLRDPAWANTSVLGGGGALAAEVEALTAGTGDGDGPILVAGSRTLVHSLLGLGLVDELRLLVFPVTIGSGQRLFPDSPDKVRMTLTGSTAFDSGVVAQHYRIGAPAPT